MEEKVPEQVLLEAQRSALESGIGCGTMLRQWSDAPIIYKDNVRGLVRMEDMIVPHSELAIHVGAAGKPVLAWSISRDGRSAAVVFEKKDGVCEFTTGLAHEVLSHKLLDTHLNMFGPLKKK